MFSRKKLATVLAVITIIASMVLSACGTPTSEVTEKVVTQMVKETVIVESTPPIVEKEATRTHVPGAPFIPQEEKPSLGLSNQPRDKELKDAIGYVFDDGTVALRLAALETPLLLENGLSEVGVIEIGEGSLISGTYVVAIDLLTHESEVEGKLTPYPEGEGDDVYLTFSRSFVITNPARSEQTAYGLGELPDISVGITADSICFVVRVPDQPPGENYWRYCALEDASTSVRVNFEAKFNETIAFTMTETIAVLDAKHVLINATISEMEDPNHIKACREEKHRKDKCRADIIGAPVTNFWDEYYAQAQEKADDQPFDVIAGVVRILQEIKFDGRDRLAPGYYVVQFWFVGPGPEKEFLGATVSGKTEGGDTIENQQIPAVPASFLSSDDPGEIVSQISAWRLFGWCCFWQSNCP